MVPGNFGCGAAVLAAITMLAPSRAARSPMALPIPRLAPVMNKVFPFSVGMQCIRVFDALTFQPGTRARPGRCLDFPLELFQAASNFSIAFLKANGLSRNR